ncbi:MAG TPA: class I adenylate-forming enzyme family protein [Caulobacteraceae bacterium]
MIIESIFAHARRTPDAPALNAGGPVVGYRALAARITLARRFLTTLGLAPGCVAAICIDSNPDAWVIGLALRSLGVTTVNPRSSAEIAQFGVRAVVAFEARHATWPGLPEAASAAGAQLILAPRDLFVGSEALAPARTAPSDAPPGGHILLTSGTTGEYKKVLIPAAAEAVIAASNAAVIGLRNDTDIHVFDFGGWTAAGYFWPIAAWWVGADVVVCQHERAWLSPSLVGGARRKALIVAPHLVARLLAAPPETPLRDDAMTAFVVGGMLSSVQWQAARERLTRDIRSIFGATETALVTCTRLETAEDLRWHRINPGIEAQIVDDDDQPLPAGQVGALRVRPTRVEGYLDDPAATRDFFRDGYFYPGDLAVIGPDGRLSLQGRRTDVINVLGSKFATLPIEVALQDQLSAVAVCVFSAPGETGEEVHVAIQPGRPLEAAALQAALVDAMPPGISSVRVHTVSGFARNHMGKIDRAALMAQLVPRPDPAGSGPDRPSDSPG